MILNEANPHFRGAKRKSNNTAETQAILNAVEHVLANQDDFGEYKKILICTDSQVAMRCITGYDSNNANWELVKRTRLLLKEFMTVPEGEVQRTVEFMKVTSHRDDE